MVRSHGFEIYLRTGRQLAPGVNSLETKFNPWHDPDDGQFTFAGQGQRYEGVGPSGARGPYALSIIWIVDGEEHFQEFPNEKGGK